MKMNFLYIILFVFILTIISCGKVKSFEFRKIESWVISGIGLESNTLSVRLLFYNPNTFPISLKHVEGDIALEGREMGFGFSDTLIHIAPQKEFSLPVDIRLKNGQLLLNGLDFLMKDSVYVQFKGFARVGRSSFFIKYKFDTENKIPNPLKE